MLKDYIGRRNKIVSHRCCKKKKKRFREFLKVIGAAKENKQSWNDNFAAFMADEGSGLLHTSKASTESKKKRKAKEEEK